MIPDELIPDDMIPVAGGAALGLLGIGGIAMALRRRKRRREEDELHAAKWAMIEASAEQEPELKLKPNQVVEPEPAIARMPAPVHDPVAPSAGRHVQAAYRGPTPDNPSVSLEYRLRKAAILDRQEQEAAAAAGHATKVPEKIGWAEPNRADFMLRRADVKATPKPVTQGR